MKLKIQMYSHKYEVSKVAPSKVPKVDSRAAIKQSNKIWKNAKVSTLLNLTIENVRLQTFCDLTWSLSLAYLKS